MSQRRSDASAAATDEAVTHDGDDSARLSELRAVSEASGAATAVTPATAPDDQNESAATDGAKVAELLETLEGVQARLTKLERRNMRARLLGVALVLSVIFFGVDHFFPDGVVVQQTLMESTEVKLVDNEGNPRLFLRMFSRVPVLQILGDNGTPRMSLGLRFDSTPFLDLSDRTGRTRATFEMTEDDTPLIQFYDENGNRTTRLN
jgi:hypothetical protein